MKHRLLAAGLVLGGLGSLVVVELLAVTLCEHRTAEARIRRQAVELSGLPDLALATGSMAFRHRSLTDLDSLFGDDPELPEYFPASQIYAIPPVVAPREASSK